MWNKLIAWIKSWFAKKVEPKPAGPTPIKLAHGGSCPVPDADKSFRPHGKEEIHHVGPFSDFRVLEVSDDCFLDSFILPAVRLIDNQLVGDDLTRGDVVYAFDHWSISTSSNKTTTNPLPLDGVDKGTFRAWWVCYKKA